MTIITEIDLKFKSGNDVAVQDVRLTREEWAQVKAYIENKSEESKHVLSKHDFDKQ